MTHNKSYKQMQTELDEIMNQLQSTELDIDKALELYKSGEKLIKSLDNYLKTAKNSVTKLSK